MDTATLNGIGTALLGIGKQDEQNVATATAWFTVLYFPVYPMKRLLVQFFEDDKYRVLEEMPLVQGEVVKTYLFGWIVFPLLTLTPGALAFFDVELPGPWWWPYVYTLVALAALKFWHDMRRDSDLKPRTAPAL